MQLKKEEIQANSSGGFASSQSEHASDSHIAATVNTNNAAVPAVASVAETNGHAVTPSSSSQRPAYSNRPSLTFNRKQEDHKIHIRCFQSNDSNGVRQICWDQFRSLTIPAFTYYLMNSGRDLLVLLIITFQFLTFAQLIICLVIYLLYIIIRCRLEFEMYIRNDCPDLHDIQHTYMMHPKSRFWVGAVPDEGDVDDTESSSEPSSAKNEHTVDTKSMKNEANDAATKHEKMNHQHNENTPTILGCIGLIPYKGDHSVGHIVRLVVSVESRGKRIGSRLLSQLEEFAKSVHYRELRIFTNNLNPSSLRFVRRNGFELVQEFRRGLMRGDLMAWKKSLAEEDGGKTMRFPDESAYTVLD